MQYRVKIIEFHCGYVTVEAKDKNEARQKAEEFIMEDDLETQYDSTSDSDTWPVFPA